MMDYSFCGLLLNVVNENECIVVILLSCSESGFFTRVRQKLDPVDLHVNSNDVSMYVTNITTKYCNVV